MQATTSALTSPSTGSRCTASMRVVPLPSAGSCDAAKFCPSGPAVICTAPKGRTYDCT
jgi:hypothetical protein